jgi:hypothetical protein
MKTLFQLSLTALAATTLFVGCGGPSYERTSISDVSIGDLDAISVSNVTMQVGAASKAIVRPYDDDGEVMSGDVTSDDPTILEIAPSLAPNEYMFMARTIGTTNVRYIAEGGVVAIARVNITPQ